MISKSHVQQKKFNTIFKNRQPKHNSDDVIFNCSKISLPDTEMSPLVRGDLINIIKKLNYEDYLTNFELFYRSKNGKLSFLDLELSREGNKFATTVYRKPTFTGVYTQFDSFLPTT